MWIFSRHLQETNRTRAMVTTCMTCMTDHQPPRRWWLRPREASSQRSSTRRCTERAAAAGAASRLPAPTASPPARALAVKPLNIPPMIFTLTPKVSMRHSLVFDEYSQHFQPRYFEHVNNASIPSHAGFRVVFPQQMKKCISRICFCIISMLTIQECIYESF